MGARGTRVAGARGRAHADVQPSESTRQFGSGSAVLSGGGPRFLLVASSSGRGGTGEMTERMEGGGVENRLHIDVYVHVL